MPNFTATLRMSYRDVDGLVMSCARDDIIEDPVNEGKVYGWRNRARGLPSVPQYRSPSTTITYAGGKFINFRQSGRSIQPDLETIGDIRRVKFTKANSQYLSLLLEGLSFPSVARPPTIAFQFEPGADASGDQVIFGDSAGNVKLSRKVGGNYQFKVGAATGTDVGDLPAGTWIVAGTTALSWYRDNNFEGSQATSPSTQFSPGLYYLGRNSAGNYLDGYLDSFHIWARQLSTLERDFVWMTLNEDGDQFHDEIRAQPASVQWTDETGDANDGEIVRVRSETAINQFFKKVIIAGSTPRRVQIAAAVNGIVLPDSSLTDLFHLAWLEVPGAGTPPAVYQDVGWSSVFDCALINPGHYCAKVWRPNGGGVLIHFDVETA